MTMFERPRNPLRGEVDYDDCCAACDRPVVDGAGGVYRGDGGDALALHDECLRAAVELARELAIRVPPGETPAALVGASVASLGPEFRAAVLPMATLPRAWRRS